jgi:hypothetical protein
MGWLDGGIVTASEVTQSMTSKDVDRRATLAMTVLFHVNRRNPYYWHL